jgi:hypothetical protein
MAPILPEPSRSPGGSLEKSAGAAGSSPAEQSPMQFPMQFPTVER